MPADFWIIRTKEYPLKHRPEPLGNLFWQICLGHDLAYDER